MPSPGGPNFSDLEVKPTEPTSPAETLISLITGAEKSELSETDLAERNQLISTTLDRLEESSHYLAESVDALVTDISDNRDLQGQLLEDCETRCSAYVSGGGDQSAIADVIAFNSRLNRDRASRGADSSSENQDTAQKVIEALNVARFEIESPAADRTQSEQFATIRNALAAVQDEFDQLRLKMKSMVHDLESTHRENDYLRASIERLS